MEILDHLGRHLRKLYPNYVFLLPRNSSLEDIDRFFDTKPGIFIHRNKLATQLRRPSVYEEEDARIGHMDDKTDSELIVGEMARKSDECVKKICVN